MKTKWVITVVLLFFTLPLMGEEKLKEEPIRVKITIEINNFITKKEIEIRREKDKLLAEIKEKNSGGEESKEKDSPGENKKGKSGKNSKGKKGIVDSLDRVEKVGIDGEKGPLTKETKKETEIDKEKESSSPEEKKDDKNWLEKLWGNVKKGLNKLGEWAQKLLKNFFAKKRSELNPILEDKARELAKKYPHPHMTEEERYQQILGRLKKRTNEMMNRIENHLATGEEYVSPDFSPLPNNYDGRLPGSSSKGSHHRSPSGGYGGYGSDSGSDYGKGYESDSDHTSELPGDNVDDLPGETEGFLPSGGPDYMAPIRNQGAVMAKGAKGEAVKDLQKRLTKLGFGVRDTGVFGPTTEKTLKDFQRAYGVEPTGKLGPTTLKVLEAVERTPSFDDIRGGDIMDRGTAGKGVKDLQKRLTELGYGVKDTGVFGPTTEKTLKDFQRSHGVEPTGKLGPTTLKALEKAEKAEDFGPSTTFTAYDNGRPIGKIRVVYINGKPVEIGTARAYKRMETAARRDGIRLRIVSGFRTNRQQRYLYNLYRRGIGNLAARPGHSNHQNGVALDLNTSDPGVYSWLRRNARRFGFIRTVPSEKWHWEYRP